MINHPISRYVIDIWETRLVQEWTSEHARERTACTHKLENSQMEFWTARWKMELPNHIPSPSSLFELCYWRSQNHLTSGGMYTKRKIIISLVNKFQVLTRCMRGSLTNSKIRLISYNPKLITNTFNRILWAKELFSQFCCWSTLLLGLHSSTKVNTILN